MVKYNWNFAKKKTRSDFYKVVVDSAFSPISYHLKEICNSYNRIFKKIFFLV